MSKENFDKTLKYLQDKDKCLFLLTSNRWEGHSEDIPKSSQLAYMFQEKLGPNRVTIIDVSKLKIYECEGNVSFNGGNNCGLKGSLLKNGKDKTGIHRCWASFNNKDDELYRVVNELMESNVVLFFGSIRWGKMNAVYSRLIERLTWLENRHATLGESNVLKDIECGVISVGHNWNGAEAVKHEKEVLNFFGFKTPPELFWSYQWTKDAKEESKSGYKQDAKDFQTKFVKLLKESVLFFREFFFDHIPKKDN